MSRDFQHPDFGNTGQVRSFGTLQGARSQAYAELGAAVATLKASPGIACASGQAIEAVRLRLDRLRALASDLGHVVDTWQRSSTTYADALDRIQARAADARHDLYMGHRQQAVLEAESADGTGGGYFTAEAAHAQHLINSAHATLAALAVERDELDATCAASLNLVGFAGQSADWAGMVDLYAGATSIVDIRARRQELIDETADALTAALGTRNEEDVNALASLLDLMARDPSLASQFWITRGSQALAALAAIIDGHGDDFAGDGSLDQVYAAACALRRSLSAASQAWTPAEAESFAAALLARSSILGGGIAPDSELVGLGFLFGNPDDSPMSATLTVAVADVIDARDRTGAPVPDGMPHVSLTLYLHELAHADGAVGDFSVGQAVDPMSQVLATLGTYPDAAWQWLQGGAEFVSAAGDAVLDRVDYWFSRDWSSDGWEGIGALFEGSLRHEGGLVTGPPNTASWVEHCDAVARMIGGLKSGLREDGSLNLADTASADIGRGLATIMPLLAAGMEYSSQTHGTLASAQIAAGYADPVTVPFVHDGELVSLMGVVALSDAGYAELLAGVARTEELMISEANAEATAEAWTLALTRVSLLEGTFHGSVGGAEIVAARLDDAEVESRLSVATAALDLLPGPPIDGVAAWAMGQLQAAAIGNVVQGAATHEALALGAFDDARYAQESAFRSAIERLAQNPDLTFGATEPNPVAMEDKLDLMATTYSATYGNAGFIAQG